MPTGKAIATLNGKVIAEATEWQEVEGNVYFPPSSVVADALKPSDLHSTCPWKGKASYYTLVDGEGTLSLPCGPF